MVIEMLGLYIHIPFCKSLCKFCDFPKRINQSETIIKKYLNKLNEDILSLAKKSYVFDTVYIGGGTPNYLSIKDMEELLNNITKLKTSPNFEFTIEGNFELLTKEYIELYAKYKVNRVSLGVQTFNNKIGKYINRISNYDVLKEKIKCLNDNNINNINVDLIFGLPHQTLNDVKNDLDLYLNLNIPHISYYSLILEDKSVLGYEIEHNLISLPDNDLCADMYEYIVNKLKNSGYHHYEISNFSIPNFESKHNLKYWSQEEYIGLGMGSSSFINGKRISNSNLITDYLDNKNITSFDSEMGEFFWLGLRKIDGVSLKEFKEKYHNDPYLLYNINELLDNGLLEINGDFIKLTAKGLDCGNDVFSYFI